MHSHLKGLGMQWEGLQGVLLAPSVPLWLVVLGSSAVPLECSFPWNYDARIFHDTKLQGLQLLQVSPHSLLPPLVSKS